MPAGRYTLAATLAGFEDASRPDIIVRPGEGLTVNVTLKPGCLAIADYIDMGIAWVVKESDVIAHIRIPVLDLPEACTASSHCACLLHHATTVRLMKGPPEAARDLRLMQEGAGANGQERPYTPGDEFIAFLKRDDRNDAFTRVLGTHYAFRVRNGRVAIPGRVPAGFATGMTIAEFEKALRGVR